MLTNSAIYTIALAVLVAFSLSISSDIDKPQWHDRRATMELSTASNNKNEDDNMNDDSTVRYIGGDGKTMLTGHWHYANDELSTSSNSKNEDDESKSSVSAPVIVMAHGMGLTQDQGLQEYIYSFQQAGMNVFTFDYATFGQSDGLPRHQISPNSHVADLRATIDMLSTLEKVNDKNKSKIHINVDTLRIGLWGTSLGGGHVLQQVALASNGNVNPSIKAVVSQVPHLASGFESVVMPILLSRTPFVGIQGLGYFVLGLVKWSIYTIFLRKPAYYPIVGLPGTAAMMQNPGDYSGYLKLASQTSASGSNASGASSSNSGWTNAATTVSGLKIVFQYRPLSYVDSIVTPTLLVAAQDDTLCPAKYVREAHARIQGSEFYEHAHAGHFDIYRGQAFQDTLEKQVAFFQKHLILQA